VLRTALTATLVSILAVLGAGCGGDGGLTLEEFRSQANAICAETERSLRELPPPEDTAAGVAAYADGAVPILDERHERLRELTAPPPEEESFAALLEETANERDALRELAGAARREDHDAAGDAARRGRIATVRVGVLAVRLELRECVRRPQSA
jgi:hypothetical protein